jgi:hypothetical protein
MPRVPTDVMAEANKQLQQAKDFKPKLRAQYDSEPKVSIYLSPMYRPYFGRTMRVMINGISIYMPVDGSTHQVPQTFADEITRRRMCIDAMLTKQHRMSDIQSNYERAPGELSLF